MHSDISDHDGTIGGRALFNSLSWSANVEHPRTRSQHVLHKPSDPPLSEQVDTRIPQHLPYLCMHAKLGTLGLKNRRLSMTHTET
jgi:hypothetical protein